MYIDYTDPSTEYIQNEINYANEEPQLKHKQKQKQKQTEVQTLELTYGHLGRLMQSAEILAYKLNIIKKNTLLKYQGYDTFEVGLKKDTDTIKYDVINFLDFYEKAIILHNKNYKYVPPKSINELINDLNLWKQNASADDKRFFQSILDLIQTGSYNTSLFPDENFLYQKAMKDNAKFKKDAGFWKTFSVPILKFLSNLIKKTQEKVNNNPNYRPDIHFGSKPVNNDYLKAAVEIKNKEIEINAKLNEINNILCDISPQKKNLQLLVNAVKNFNILYSEIKKKYGDEIQLDLNSITLLKNLISSKNLDSETYKLLNNLSIDIDPESFQ